MENGIMKLDQPIEIKIKEGYVVVDPAEIRAMHSPDDEFYQKADIYIAQYRIVLSGMVIVIPMAFVSKDRAIDSFYSIPLTKWPKVVDPVFVQA